MANTKITKTQRFEDLSALIHGEPVKYGTTIEDADAFIAHEVELLSKKNSGERKETDTQKANRKYQALIAEYLAIQNEGRTCTEIAKGISELSDFNNQKVAALMRGMVEAGTVRKATVKGKSLFSLT
jgi:hypothetical protein